MRKLTNDEAVELHSLIVGKMGISQDGYGRIYDLVSSLATSAFTSTPPYAINQPIKFAVDGGVASVDHTGLVTCSCPKCLKANYPERGLDV